MARTTVVHRVVNSREALEVFRRECRRAKEIHLAVAWATESFPGSAALRRARGRIRSLVVGIGGYITEPAFLERWQRTARVYQQAAGIFHPKVFMFVGRTATVAIVGSSNLTAGGFGGNTELNVVTRGPSDAKFFRDLLFRIEAMNREASPVTESLLRAYKAARKRSGGPKMAQEPGLELPVFTHTTGRTEVQLDVGWPVYLALLKKQRQRGVVLEPVGTRLGYLGTLHAAQAVLRRRRTFARMSREERQVVGGFGTGGNDHGWFGFMGGSGRFMNTMYERPAKIDAALSHIATRGVVEQDAFLRFVRVWERLGLAVGTGSRLLAMKRPDFFICVDSRNRSGLAGAFGIPASALQTWDGYWQCIERIHQCPWFFAEKPKPRRELELWQGRVALLDAVFYRPRR